MNTEKLLALNPDLQGKINHACKVVEEVFCKYQKPVILCSFGKDSILMLWMIREWFNKETPIVLYRHPFFPKKYGYADRMMAEWDLDVHQNIPPVGCSITSKQDQTEIVQHFPLGAGTLQVPIGRQSIEAREKWLCGVEDILEDSHGSYNWPYDVCFVGHKSSDIDPVQGALPLKVDIHQNVGSSHLAFPLRHFTDEDVWTLFKAWEIPFDRLRYGNIYDPKSDNEGAFNSDYFPYCNKCFDPYQPDFVICPKSGLEITNIHRSLAKTDIKLNYMGGVE